MLRNLQGVADCDRVILNELRRARIPALVIPEPARGGVPYAVVGKLDAVVFRRGFVHFSAAGPVPLEVAQGLYSDPVGREDLLVAGHEGRPDPRDWATLREGAWFVDSYRIETEVGLRLFADALREDTNRQVRMEARLLELEAALRPFGEAYQKDMDRLAEIGTIVRLGTQNEIERTVPLSAFKRARDLVCKF